MRRGELAETKESFENALALFRQAHSIFGEATSCQSLGRLYLQQGNLQEASLFLNRALLLHQQCQSPSDEAIDLNLLERLPVRKQEIFLGCTNV